MRPSCQCLSLSWQSWQNGSVSAFAAAVCGIPAAVPHAALAAAATPSVANSVVIPATNGRAAPLPLLTAALSAAASAADARAAAVPSAAALLLYIPQASLAVATAPAVSHPAAGSATSFHAWAIPLHPHCPLLLLLRPLMLLLSRPRHPTGATSSTAVLLRPSCHSRPCTFSLLPQPALLRPSCCGRPCRTGLICPYPSWSWCASPATPVWQVCPFLAEVVAEERLSTVVTIVAAKMLTK